MKILVVTQKVSQHDPILGFFHRWLEEFAKNFEKVTVICLEQGEFKLPENVKVLFLGKEENKSHLEYLSRFYRYIWNERKEYDTVFVHMNQEYVLLAGDMWRLMGKKVYLWRNHAKGTLLTDMAVWMSQKVFCTSPKSYTAQFGKTVLMPVGIDTEFFKPDSSVEKIPNSILFLGRISPVKKVLEFVEWFAKKDESFTATIAGPTSEKDKAYEALVHQRVSDLGLTQRVKFIGEVNQEGALKLYQSHETYVNLTPSGSMDKAILEAASCEVEVVVENKDLKILVGKKGKELRDFVIENHSLEKLFKALALEVNLKKQ